MSPEVATTGRQFRMPSLGADMEDGVVLEWRIKPGDRVHCGDVVAVVQTDKADLDVEIFEDGVVTELLVPVGTRVPVGTVLALLDGGAQPVPEPVPPPEPAPIPVSPPEPVPVPPPEPIPPPEPVFPPVGHGTSAVTSPVVRHLAAALGVDPGAVHGSGPGGRVHREDVLAAAHVEGRAPARPSRPRASPRARRLARERGVDLGTLTGTGPGGAVISRDLSAPARAVGAPAPAPAAATGPVSPAPAAAPAIRTAEERALAMRRAIALRMENSWREIPHYHLFHRIDLSEPLAWLAAENERRPVTERILPAALLVKATALAARDVPQLNGTWVDGGFRPSPTVDIAMTVSLRMGGLVTPVIAGADSKDLASVMAALRDLVTRARANKLKASELSGGSITITNLGDQGVEAVFGVLNHPQVALVGFGAIHDEPVAVNGMLAVRPMVVVSLAADHRASDGVIGARLLHAIDHHLHHPEAL